MPRNTSPAQETWFLVVVTDASAAPEYEWLEVWYDGAAYVEKEAGRYGGAENPGVALDGATFAVDDYALCRSAEGAGGLVWELLPLSATSSSRSSPARCAWYTGLTADDCLELVGDAGKGVCAAVPAQTLNLAYDSGGGTGWISDTDFRYDGGSGGVTFDPGTGSAQPTLTIGGTLGRLLGCEGGALVYGFSGGLCDGTRAPCANYFVVRVRCAACPTDTGSYAARPSALDAPIPAGETGTYPLYVSGITTGTAPSVFQFQAASSTGTNLSNLALTLTAPDGTTTFTLLNAPSSTATGLTALFGAAGTSAASGITQSSGTVFGYFLPDDALSSYTGNSNGTWSLNVANSGTGTVSVGSASITFGAPTTSLTMSTPTATPSSGTSPLSVSISASASGGTPYFAAVDTGSGPQFFQASDLSSGKTFTFSTTTEAVAYFYTNTGAYVENSVAVYVAIPGGTSCSGAVDLGGYGSFSLITGPAGESRYYYLTVPASTLVHMTAAIRGAIPNGAMEVFDQTGNCCATGGPLAGTWTGTELGTGYPGDCQAYTVANGKICVRVYAQISPTQQTIPFAIATGAC